MAEYRGEEWKETGGGEECERYEMRGDGERRRGEEEERESDREGERGRKGERGRGGWWEMVR